MRTPKTPKPAKAPPMANRNAEDLEIDVDSTAMAQQKKKLGSKQNRRRNLGIQTPSAAAGLTINRTV
jgi:hypothetical protein|tara:strand:- start:4601 stop:4801 length:201 start_codon:yes stop_codon:yes gene_type:complete